VHKTISAELVADDTEVQSLDFWSRCSS